MKQTTLDLNGPILSFSANPVGVASTGVASGTGSGIATFTGIATASFPTGVSTGSPNAPTNPASNTGIITYRWYEVGVGALSDSQYVTGTATTSLTLSRLITPTDNQRKFYLTADYIPSAYQSSSPVTAGTARSTGNALNEPFSSGIGTLTVYPLIEIVAQPTNRTVATNQNATFSVNAGLTDNSFANDLTYQWYWNGVPLTQNNSTVVTFGSINVSTTTTTYETRQQTVFRRRQVTEQRSENRTFTSNGSVTLHPTSYDVVVRVASGSGGNGGSDAGAGGGAGGAGRFGRFFYNPGGRTLDFKIGRRGNDGASNATGSGGGNGGFSNGLGDGGKGGNAGGLGSSGGGGGGGGSTGVFDSRTGRQTIIAAGGSGGGGASYPGIPGLPGSPGGGFGGGPIAIATRGNNGEDKNGDGGGGGGAGGGSEPRGAGGRAGADASAGNRQAEGGGRTFGSYDSSQMTFPFDGSENYGDGYAQIEWKWVDSYVVEDPYTETITVPVEVTTTTTQTIQQNTTLSGALTPTLTVSADYVGVGTAQCKITSATSTNSPIFTDVVNFNTVSAADQYNINIETIGITNTASLTGINLFNGDYEFTSTPSSVVSGNVVDLFSIYAPDRNILVEMDLYGGVGSSVGSNAGGEGGFSRIRFTMERNVEYVIAGLTDVGTPFIYKKGILIACVGKGGNAGSGGKGGFGGGVNVAGQDGFGRNAGVGGAFISAGSLGANGVFGSLTSLTATSPDTKATGTNGGRTIKCTKGVYWQQQGISACSDLGATQFRLSDGTIVTNTSSSITRGFKSGYNIIQTAGIGAGGGNGGSGANGGGGGSTSSGGGGGSGYTDGSVTVVNTQLGGSSSTPKVILRYVS